MNSIIQQINETSVPAIIYGLISITDLVKNGEPVLEEADAIFEALVPKLKHNNYKIRTMSFALMEYLILKSYSKLLNPVAALPNLIFGISSVNKQIQQSAKVCVKFLLVQAPIGTWWKEVEFVLQKSKSKETIYELLGILTQLEVEIPLTCIIQMIDSPDPTIRKYSETIISKSDRNRVMYAISRMKVSYQTFRKIENLVDNQETRSIDYQDESMIPYKNGKRVIPSEDEDIYSHKFAARQSEPHLITENDNYLDPKYEQDTQDIDDDESQLQFEEKETRFLQPDDDCILHSDSIDDDIQTDYSDVESLHSMKNKKGINFANKDKFDQQSIRSKQSSRRGIDEDSQSSISRRSRRSSASQQPEARNIGTIRIKPRKSLPFALRDLTGKTWLERLTYFEMLDEAIETGRCTNLNGSDIMSCILTGIFPTHKKLIAISISILTKTITYFPESLIHNYSSVVSYILAIFKQSQNDPKFLELISVLSQEGDISEVVEAAVSAESDKNRPVNSIAFILCIFQSQQNITLNQKAICNLLGFLLKDTNISENSQLLLRIICSNQRDLAMKYYYAQTPKYQSILRKFIPKIKPQRDQPQQTKQKNDDVLIQNLSKQDLLFIIKQESRKGNQARIPRMVSAYKQYRADDLKELESLFFIFLHFLSVIDDDLYDQNIKQLFDVAFTQFSSSKIISAVNSPTFTIDLIHGLARFVWNCPSTTLSKGQNIYNKIYELFCQSDGNTRLEIVQIIIALEKVTGVSFISLETIKPIHKKVLNKLREQFVIE